MNPTPGAARGRLLHVLGVANRRDEDGGKEREGRGEGSLEGARARCSDLCARYRALWRN